VWRESEKWLGKEYEWANRYKTINPQRLGNKMTDFVMEHKKC